MSFLKYVKIVQNFVRKMNKIIRLIIHFYWGIQSSTNAVIAEKLNVLETEYKTDIHKERNIKP